MASFNWSMTAIGYAQHRRSAQAVFGLSHMSTHEVLRFAEALGVTTGWMVAQGSQPQLEGMRIDRPTFVALAELFADRRVVMTDGLANGSLVFAAASAEQGTPPDDRTLVTWADERPVPWVEIIDNEISYWGGLRGEQVEKLLAWYLCQRPIDGDWRQTKLSAGATARLRGGLFEHGWTRNLGLAKPGRKAVVDLWGGVHRTCILDHAGYLAPHAVHSGVRLTLDGGEWQHRDLSERCPVDDDNGKLGAR